MSDDLASLLQTEPDLRSIAPRRVTFWSGTGISYDAPTQAPLGDRLTDRTISQAFDGAVLLRELRRAYAALGLTRDRPRLETVLEVAVAEHGTALLAVLLDDLRDAPPNDTHRLFAVHTQRGGWHVTANFDTCIERAGGEPSRIVHVHGALGDAGGVETLGARLSRIERGFDADQKSQLDAVLADTDLLIIVGYSGLDYFDVDPYWRDAAVRGLLRGRRVLWVNHADNGSRLVSGAACERKQLRIVADTGGADVHEISAPTRQVLNAFATSWGFTPICEPPPWEDRPEPRVVLSDGARVRATTRLFVTAGLPAAASDRLTGGALGVEEHGWAASVAWAAGHYRDAAGHWNAAYSRSEAASVAARRERWAACLWLQGRLRAARTLLSRTLADSTIAEVDPAQRLIIAETLSRVLVHMRRLPDTRLLVTRRRVAAAVATLDEIERALSEQAHGRSLPVHLRARVDSARADLTGSAQPTNADEGGPVRDFDESEALLAMANYQHAQLRARANAGDQPAPVEYRRHRDRFEALGATGDAARVPLLPGAARAFGLREVVRDLARCDFTRYHLARLVALHVLQRLRDR